MSEQQLLVLLCQRSEVRFKHQCICVFLSAFMLTFTVLWRQRTDSWTVVTVVSVNQPHFQILVWFYKIKWRRQNAVTLVSCWRSAWAWVCSRTRFFSLVWLLCSFLRLDSILLHLSMTSSFVFCEQSTAREEQVNVIPDSTHLLGL